MKKNEFGTLYGMPEEMRQKVEENVNEQVGDVVIPSKHKRYGGWVAAAVAAFVLVFSGVCVTHPAMADGVPGIGSIFAKVGESMGFGGDYTKYAKKVKEPGNDKVSEITGYTKISNGVTITLQEAYCNDNALYLSMIVNSQKAFPVDQIKTENGIPQLISDLDIYLPFKTSDVRYDTISGEFINDHQYECVIRSGLDDQLIDYRKDNSVIISSENESEGIRIPDHFNVQVSLKKILGCPEGKEYTGEDDGMIPLAKGSWFFSFYMDSEKDGTTTRTLKVGGLKYIDSVTLIKTPFDISMTYHGEYDGPEGESDEKYPMQYKVVITDANGRLLKDAHGFPSQYVAVKGHDLSHVTVYVISFAAFRKDIMSFPENGGDGSTNVFHFKSNGDVRDVLDKNCLWKKTISFDD